MHPATLLARGRPQFAERLPEAERAVSDGEFGRDRQTAVLHIEQQFPPILGAFACAVGEAEQLLFALWRRADDDRDALLGVFKTGLQVNAVGPHVDVAFGRQIALPPMLVLVAPDLLQPRDGRGRQARRILAEQGGKRLREVAGRDALQVEDRDQHLQAARAPRVGRQDRGCEADAPGIAGSATVAYPRLAHADRADAGHHLAFRQVPVTNHAAQAGGGLQIHMLGKEFGHLGLNRLRQQGARSVTQHLGERVGERSWLKQLDEVTIGHGVSLLCWRSGGSDTPRYAAFSLSARHQLLRITRGAGEGTVGPDLLRPMPATAYFTEAGLRALIRNSAAVRHWSAQQMPAFDNTTLPNSVIDTVIAYLRYLAARSK